MKTMLRTALIPLGLGMAFAGGMVASPALADQPYMHQALDQLASARETLRAGTPDKGGHRLRAIALVDRAMAEVRMGIGYDRSH